MDPDLPHHVGNLPECNLDEACSSEVRVLANEASDDTFVQGQHPGTVVGSAIQLVHLQEDQS